MNSKLRSKNKIEKKEGKKIIRKTEKEMSITKTRILSRFSYHRARKIRDYNLQYKKRAFLKKKNHCDCVRRKI